MVFSSGSSGPVLAILLERKVLFLRLAMAKYALSVRWRVVDRSKKVIPKNEKYEKSFENRIQYCEFFSFAKIYKST